MNTINESMLEKTHAEETLDNINDILVDRDIAQPNKLYRIQQIIDDYYTGQDDA